MVPSFETDRLLLRALDISHVPGYEKHFLDYEVISHLSAAVPWPYPPGGVKEFIEKSILPRQGKDRWAWALFEKENPVEAIGCVDVWREGCPENRGFWLGKKFWGRGLMEEAVRPVLAYCFQELGFEKMIFSNAVGNLRSRRIKEKTGARFVGVAPARFVNPAYLEHELWELTRQDWEKRNFQLELFPPGESYERSFREGMAELVAPHERLAWLYLGDAADEKSSLQDFPAYVAKLLARKNEAAPGFVCDDVFWAVVGQEVVGRISLRHELNDTLRVMGGHIGYIVKPSWRGRGVATEMLRKVLRTPRAKEIGRILLTCDETNLASEKTIVKNGGVFEGLVEYAQGKPKKKRFWIDLGLSSQSGGAAS